MMIIDAIDSAPTEHAVYFLVSAYLESLHHFHRSSGLPEAVVTLPVAGPADLNARLTALRSNVDAPLDPVVPASEVFAVLMSALKRVGAPG